MSGSSCSSCIGVFNNQEGGEHERRSSRGHGSGCGRGRGRGRGSDSGRGQGHNTYSLSRPYGNGDLFPKAKIYDRGQYQSFYQYQQTAIQELKIAAGWINGYTSPNGYVLDDKGYTTLSTSLISAVQSNISQTKTATASHLMVPLLSQP